jgi:hypothetical protein
MGRIDLIISRVLYKVKDRGEHDIQKDEILSEMNQVQVDLCRDYFAIKVELKLILTAQQEQYPLDPTIFKIKEFIEPAAWDDGVEVVDNSARWAKIKRCTQFPTVQPLFGFQWNRILNLFPAPPITGEEITVLAYALPSVVLAFGADPEVGSEWDEALFLGTMNKLIGGDWSGKYDTEANKQMHQAAKESVKGIIKKESFIDDIGF